MVNFTVKFAIKFAVNFTVNFAVKFAKCMQLSEEHKRNQIGPEDDEWRSGKERWKRDDNR